MDCKEWKIPPEGENNHTKLLEAGFSPLMAMVLQARGLDTPEKAMRYLSRGEALVHDPLRLPDMQKAVARINQAIQKREKLAVYGDYDVDGISASCLLADYFADRGIACEVYIPDRLDEGYGMNLGAIDALHKKGTALIVTVDCGITAVNETAYAKSLGIDIIITDHHECPQTLPNAVAVVDPKRPDSEYPFDALAGVGVAFKLVCALENGFAGPLERYADLIAVGTVADVMPLVDENRFFVHHGLKKLKSAPRPGFAALLEEAGAGKKPITASTIGFTLAPRINAAGRLCETETALRLLLSKDSAETAALAKELCELNRKRQALELQVWEDALRALSEGDTAKPIVLESASWHPGVVGIAASRLAEEFGVPAIMICTDGENAKGSCRSCGDFNLIAALSACSEHLESFGGHAFAAGLNIKPEKIEAFKAALWAYYSRNLPVCRPVIEPELLINDPAVLSLEGVRSLDELEPCGSRNVRPLMCFCDAYIESVQPIGNGKHLRLKVSKNGVGFDCVYFSHTPESLDVCTGAAADLCFIPQINDFNARSSVQLLLYGLRPSETPDMCRGILECEDFSVEDVRAFRPEREDLARAWRHLKRPGGLELGYDELSRSNGPDFMAPQKFCLCIKILSELKLLNLSTREGRFSCLTCDNGAKTELEKSRLFRLLWEKAPAVALPQA